MYDALNLLLAMKGYTLIETPRYFQVVPLAGPTGKWTNRILQGEDEAKDVRPGELVTMLLPLNTLTADDATRFITPLVSTFGTGGPDGQGPRHHPDGPDGEHQPHPRPAEGTGPGPADGRRRRAGNCGRSVLQHASARDMAAIITNLFGVGGPTVMQAYDGRRGQGRRKRRQPDAAGLPRGHGGRRA